jgi:hypothetical protein
MHRTFLTISILVWEHEFLVVVFLLLLFLVVLALALLPVMTPLPPLLEAVDFVAVVELAVVLLHLDHLRISRAYEVKDGVGGLPQLRDAGVAGLGGSPEEAGLGSG